MDCALGRGRSGTMGVYCPMGRYASIILGVP